MAGKLHCMGPLSGATFSNFDVRPAEVHGSFVSYTNGRRQFWKGSNTKQSEKILPIDQEATMQTSFFHKVLAPTNAAVQGDDLLGWSATGIARSVAPLGGKPDFMCAPASLLLEMHAGVQYGASVNALVFCSQAGRNASKTKLACCTGQSAMLHRRSASPCELQSCVPAGTGLFCGTVTTRNMLLAK